MQVGCQQYGVANIGLVSDFYRAKQDAGVSGLANQPEGAPIGPPVRPLHRLHRELRPRHPPRHQYAVPPAGGNLCQRPWGPQVVHGRISTFGYSNYDSPTKNGCLLSDS